jgi:hypothetical protein
MNRWLYSVAADWACLFHLCNDQGRTYFMMSSRYVFILFKFSVFNNCNQLVYLFGCREFISIRMWHHITIKICKNMDFYDLTQFNKFPDTLIKCQFFMAH